MDDAEAAEILATTAGACAVAAFLLPSFWGATVACALAATAVRRGLHLTPS